MGVGGKPGGVQGGQVTSAAAAVVRRRVGATCRSVRETCG